MNFNQKELNIIGHWSSSSKMPERYGRAVCVAELLLRNTIIQNFVSGWSIAPSFHLPLTAPSDLRIGKMPEDKTIPADTLSATGPCAVVDDGAQISDAALTPPTATLEPDEQVGLGETE